MTYAFGALVVFGLFVLGLIVLTCGGGWEWLGTEKDSIDAVTKIIGLGGLVVSGSLFSVHP